MRRSGFTLLEIMAVITIIGMISTLVIVNVMERLEGARVQTTQAKLAGIESALDMFRFEQRRYPSSDQGLRALVERPDGARTYPRAGYVRKRSALEDGWSRPFGYESPGQRARVGYDLWSLGADGRPGGDDVDADIVNWSEPG